MAENDSVTNSGEITNRNTVTSTTVADKSGITKPINKAKVNASAKPTIDKLFVFDKSDSESNEFAKALRDSYYKGAKLAPISNWGGVKSALSKYSKIRTLIFFTHSTPGSLLIGNNSPTAKKQQAILSSTGVKVTDAIIFEGCEIMGDPEVTAKIVSGIAESKTQVSGHTYFSIIQIITLHLTGNESSNAIRAMFDPHQMFMLPVTKKPSELAGTSGSVKLYKRWFRSDYDRSPVPNVPTGSLPPKGIKTRQEMSPVEVSTKQNAAKVKQEVKEPTPPAYYVTITNIKAVTTK